MDVGISRFSFLLLFISVIVPASSFAESMEEMQRRLNEQVMQKPFSVEDQSRIDAYMKDAMKKNLEPVKTPPKYWQPGYTCASIRGYGWRVYSDCAYHYRYYGRYW
jgi:hypothetical protein